MANSQRSRSRRNDAKHRGDRYVAPVLDPNWQNPYAPSIAERDGNLQAARSFLLRRRRPQMVVVGVVVLALFAATAVQWWLGLVGLVVAGVFVIGLQRALTGIDARAASVASAMLATFEPSGSAVERERLLTIVDRLSATFGLTGVSSFIVGDATYNAALVPNGATFSLFVTSAVMRDFELIEIEGVVAHLMARHRLGSLSRVAASAALSLPSTARRQLAGVGVTYRADEVAAAAIRYPLGVAGALRKCGRQVVSVDSFFATDRYDQWRFTFFNVWSDRRECDMGDLDDVELRALALEEW